MSRKGFTLIELLVVISIISLLASVVLASLNSARDKGRLGGAKYFAAQVDHIAGDYAVGIWDFDECPSGAGAPVTDRSGSGNNGVLSSTPPTSSANTPSGTGCSLSFDGVATYVSAGTSVLSITDQMTISIWVKSAVSPQNPYTGFISKDDGTNRSWKLGFGSDGLSLRFDLFNATSYSSLNISNVSITDGKWHNIVVAYDSFNSKLYIDGILSGANTLVGGIRSSTALVEIGNDGCCASRIFNGLIDNPRIFAKGLIASEVERLYAEGLKSHSFAKKE